MRPHWEDGAPAYTIKKFAWSTADLSREFPLLTLRPINLKGAVTILWIWQKKSNNIHALNSHIWDGADEAGSIERRTATSSVCGNDKYEEGMFDQVDRVLYDLKT